MPARPRRGNDLAEPRGIGERPLRGLPPRLSNPTRRPSRSRPRARDQTCGGHPDVSSQGVPARSTSRTTRIRHRVFVPFVPVLPADALTPRNGGPFVFARHPSRARHRPRLRDLAESSRHDRTRQGPRQPHIDLRGRTSRLRLARRPLVPRSRSLRERRSLLHHLRRLLDQLARMGDRPPSPQTLITPR